MKPLLPTIFWLFSTVCGCTIGTGFDNKIEPRGRQFGFPRPKKCFSSIDCTNDNANFCNRQPWQRYGVCIENSQNNRPRPCRPKPWKSGSLAKQGPVDCIPDDCWDNSQCPKGYSCVYYPKLPWKNYPDPAHTYSKKHCRPDLYLLKNEDSKKEDVKNSMEVLKTGINHKWCEDDSHCPGSHCMKLSGNQIGVCAATGTESICPPGWERKAGLEVFCQRPKCPVRPWPFKRDAECLPDSCTDNSQCPRGYNCACPNIPWKGNQDYYDPTYGCYKKTCKPDASYYRKSSQKEETSLNFNEES